MLYSVQLVCTVGKDHLPLAEQIMNNLLGRQVDSNYVVRMYCIRGLGNMADIGGSQVHVPHCVDKVLVVTSFHENVGLVANALLWLWEHLLHPHTCMVNDLRSAKCDLAT